MINIQKRWEAFCGYSMKDCEYFLITSLNSLGVSKSSQEHTISSTQSFILGSNRKAKSIQIEKKI